MMEDWTVDRCVWIGGVLVLGLVVLILNGRKRRLESVLIKRLYREIPELKDGGRTIDAFLFLNMDSPAYAELDELLTEEADLSLIVIFQAPSWIIRTKTERWSRHRVIEYEKHPICRCFNGKFGRIVVTNGEQVRMEIIDAAQWMKENVRRSLRQAESATHR